jgi:predicted NAD-dependent protein-ADP-ribosyltransferase YbiA (DUF1768 family)
LEYLLQHLYLRGFLRQAITKSGAYTTDIYLYTRRQEYQYRLSPISEASISLNHYHWQISHHHKEKIRFIQLPDNKNRHNEMKPYLIKRGDCR